MRECLVDGEISAHVPADDRGLAYGDGVFETVAVLRGVPRLWEEHMDRLVRGCERLRMEMPPAALLLRDVQTACTGQSRCVAKILLTRGSGGRGYDPASAGPVRRVVSVHDFPGGLEETATRGLSVRICETRLALQPALGGIKHLNRLEQVLAAQEIHDTDSEEGVLLDREGFVVSGIAANLFGVSGQRLLTPRMDRCGVRGVVRGLILREFKSRCELRRITVDMLGECDELFLCNAVRGIVPITRIDGRSLPRGTVTVELQEWFRRRAGGP